MEKADMDIDDITDCDFQEMQSMCLELLLDPNESWKLIEQESKGPSVSEVAEFLKQNIRRNFVRSVFGSIEGMCYYLNYYAVAFDKRMRKCNGNPPIYTEEQIALMLPRPGKYVSFEDNVKGTFKKYSLLKNDGYKADFGTVGWTKVKDAAKKRDRLMHPKSKADIQVTDIELQNVRAALDWFREQTREAMESHVRAIKATGYF